jgi:DNA-binding transcriptional LysR family regulator
VLAHARTTLQEFESVREHIDAVRGLRQGEASLATTAGLASAFLPTVAQRCRAAHPAFNSSCSICRSRPSSGRWPTADTDLALAYDVPDTTVLRTLFSSEWPIGAVVPSDHPLTARATTTLADCVGFALILPAAALSLRTILDGAFGRSAIGVSPIVETTSTALMRKLVAQRQGVALLNRLDIEEDLRAGTLVFVPLRDAGLQPQRLSLVARSGNGPSPAAGLLAAQVIDCLEEALVR